MFDGGRLVRVRAPAATAARRSVSPAGVARFADTLIYTQSFVDSGSGFDTCTRRSRSGSTHHRSSPMMASSRAKRHTSWDAARRPRQGRKWYPPHGPAEEFAQPPLPGIAVCSENSDEETDRRPEDRIDRGDGRLRPRDRRQFSPGCA